MPSESTPAPVPTATGAPGPDADPNRSLEVGLDALQTNAPARRKRLGVWPLLAPVLAIAGLIGVWQLFVMSGVRPRYIVPGPMDVLTQAGAAWARGDIQTALMTSMERGLVGFAVSVVIATPIGILVARVRWVRLAFGPIITGLQVLPSVAWVPAAILWFGLTNATAYFVILMGAIPSIVNGLVAGVDHVPPLYRRVGRVLGAGPVAQVRHVVLPAALPGYVAGLKQGWAFSWRSLMAAEIIAVGGAIGFGLGSMLQQGREIQDMTIVAVAILLILVVGILVELLVFGPLERRLQRRRGLAAETAR
ncbi:ABC transporter permease [Cellulomonas bogoriensis]|uniref:Sulfate ABC transporter permease n=1 Tax=Cellulomonas bogoriensis 69B4 = DSM 16987 TaxID=1386082 RepID=A0A0A0BWU0_9CELL|nr:ABC transporter permease [Cellulomonas bogoriensis]KGM12848.1 sulfate ABC transporter permease [Cellulomonas bogoriensis 69B4 = DSM 16987]